jgi:hypothetical protein
MVGCRKKIRLSQPPKAGGHVELHVEKHKQQHGCIQTVIHANFGDHQQGHIPTVMGAHFRDFIMRPFKIGGRAPRGTLQGSDLLHTAVTCIQLVLARLAIKVQNHVLEGRMHDRVNADAKRKCSYRRYPTH